MSVSASENAHVGIREVVGIRGEVNRGMRRKPWIVNRLVVCYCIAAEEEQ